MTRRPESTHAKPNHGNVGEVVVVLLLRLLIREVGVVATES